MTTSTAPTTGWIGDRIVREQIRKYKPGDADFIDDREIESKIAANREPDPARIRAIIAKSLEIQTLEPDETAALLNVRDPDLWRRCAQRPRRSSAGCTTTGSSRSPRST